MVDQIRKSRGHGRRSASSRSHANLSDSENTLILEKTEVTSLSKEEIQNLRRLVSRLEFHPRMFLLLQLPHILV